ncbi:hypothetical protein GH714_034937 [Hevea brasiliensis]|uniref:Uncharacterized protein n=1 Tax=Hevea brasiliensis TaxID=3981 RepID=A0A6A6NKM8_HEVBR|nr:hypothetical protein GH714_034937 [Hevea brasiliensis]
MMISQVSPISSGIPGLIATSSTLRVYTPSAFPMPSAYLFSRMTRGTNASRSMGTSSGRTQTIPSFSLLSGFVVGATTVGRFAFSHDIPLPLFSLSNYQELLLDYELQSLARPGDNKSWPKTLFKLGDMDRLTLAPLLSNLEALGHI